MQAANENPQAANPASLLSQFTAWFKKTCLDAFIETYGFDGYNFVTKKATYARIFSFARNYNEDLDKATTEQNVDYVDTSLLVASFFGAPSRPEAVMDNNNKITATISAQRVAKNLAGGYDVGRHWNIDKPNDYQHPTMETTEKDRWEMVLLIFKVSILAQLKMLLILPKYLLNILKLFTEFLPAVLVGALKIAIIKLTALLDERENHVWHGLGGAAKWIGLFIVVMIPTLVLFAGSYCLKFIGRAFTSPEKGVRMAFSDAYESHFSLFAPNPFAKIFAYAIGAMAGFMSLSVTLCLWIFAFPIALGSIAFYLPAITQMGAALALKFPTITAVIHSALSLVGTVMASPVLATTLSSLIGIPFSVNLVLVGSALGAVATYIGTMTTALADKFSNWWARWNSTTGPLTSLCRACANVFASSRNAAPGPDYIPLQDLTINGEEVSVSLNVELLSGDHSQLYNAASANSAAADAIGNRVEIEHVYAPPQQHDSTLGFASAPANLDL